MKTVKPWIIATRRVLFGYLFVFYKNYLTSDQLFSVAVPTTKTAPDPHSNLNIKMTNIFRLVNEGASYRKMLPLTIPIHIF